MFNEAGAGHYDAAELCDTTQAQSLPITSNHRENIKTCSCGKNDKNNKTHCHPVTTKYTTRTQCICCTNERACTTLCCCKSCNNPFGQKPPTDDQQPLRKRQRHEMQRRVSKGAIFAYDEAEIVSSGPRSMLEFFILEAILKINIV